MTDYAIIPATKQHLTFFAEHMRKEDRDEAVAQTGKHPSVALGYTFGGADLCMVGTADGVPVCMFGLTDGAPWMVATEGLAEHAKEFLSRCRSVVSHMHDISPKLANYVDTRNTKAIRWLKWLGFVIMPPVKHGPYGALFHPFERVRV